MEAVNISQIDYLLNKYGVEYTPGEIHSPKTNLRLKQKQRIVDKHKLCDELLYEIQFNVSDYQKRFVHFLINYFSNDFKKLHGRAKKETIILAFIFYVKKIDDSRVDLNNYSISKKYNLSDSVFKLIVCRMCDSFIKSMPISYYQTDKYNHEILSKNGGKL